MLNPFNVHRGDWSYPTAVRFGAGRITELPDACRTAGIIQPLLVTDPGLAERDMVHRAVAHLEAEGLPATIFSGIQPDPVGANIDDGVAAFRKGGHDGVVAFGGGSALDAGKAIALLAGQDDGIWAHEGRWRQIPRDAIAPVVTVPTTAGTGSEVGRASVVTDEREGVKKILLNPGMMPRLVVADPELTLSLPPHLTAATGMDALAHNLEALCSPFFHPLADGIAVEGIRLVKEWLPVAYRDGDDRDARTAMLAAALMGATAFQKGLGAVHALSHPLGVQYHLHHGLTNAIVMPYVLVFNRAVVEEPLTRVARYLDLPDPGFDAFLRWMLDLRAELDIPHTLREAGLDDDRIDELARQAAADPNAEENPVPVGETELHALYQQAFEGTLPV